MKLPPVVEVLFYQVATNSVASHAALPSRIAARPVAGFVRINRPIVSRRD
jgi:hypothetical protein